jgi:hypothetical protein
VSKENPPVGSPTERLKDIFGVQKVPLASNFSDLIDVADVGRKAAGLSPDQPSGQGLGLQLDEDLKLAVLPQPAGGIHVNSAGVGITTEANKGLVVGANGLAVQAGNGINLSPTGVGITTETGKGLTVGVNGLAVQAGNGINLGSTGVGITTETGKGLVVGVNGLAVQAGNGINLGSTGVGVATEAGKGLTVGPQGVAVQPANGINVGAAGVGVTANAGRAIVVDSGGVGINYGPTLTVANSTLDVSDNAFARRRLTTTVNTASTVWLKVANIPNSAIGAYAQFHVMAWNSNFRQRFVVTLSCDGSVCYHGGMFSLSVSNVQRQATYGIRTIGLGIEYYQESIIDLEISCLGQTVNLMIDYALSDISNVVISNFTGTNMFYRLRTFDTGTNASFQS